MNRKTVIANAEPAQGRCAFMRVAEASDGRCGDHSNAVHLAAWRLPLQAGGAEMQPGEGSA